MNTLLFTPLISPESGRNHQAVEITSLDQLCSALKGHPTSVDLCDLGQLCWWSVPSNALERLSWLSEPYKLNLEGALVYVHLQEGEENGYASDILRNHKSFQSKFFGSAQSKPNIRGVCLVFTKALWLDLLVGYLGKGNVCIQEGKVW